MDEGHEGDAQVVKRFVRYALACEYQRKYIRRADVTEKGSSIRLIKMRKSNDLSSI